MISYSIIISVFNQVETLKLALESLRLQIKNPKTFEIVITDDASSDGTSEFIKRLHYPIFLKYCRSEQNLGRAFNRNRGLEKASGQWLVFIDGDMVPGPGFIKAYMNAWESFPDAISLGAYSHPEDWPKSRYYQYLESRGRLTMEHGARVPGKYFTSGNFSVKKVTLDKSGGFDTSFESWGGEDTDFGLRLDDSGAELRFIPAAFCHHYHKKSLSDLLDEYEKFGREGYPRLLKKNPGKIIFENGWLLGLPDSTTGPAKRFISIMLRPLRSAAALRLLKWLSRSGGSAFTIDLFYDWLFYGFMAKGYRQIRK